MNHKVDRPATSAPLEVIVELHASHIDHRTPRCQRDRSVGSGRSPNSGATSPRGPCLTSSAIRCNSRRGVPANAHSPKNAFRENKPTGKGKPEKVGQFWKSIDSCDADRETVNP